jgi:hypothetical protein
VVQAALGILVELGGERVVDGAGPAFFLENCQNQFLSWTRASEAIDDFVSEHLTQGGFSLPKSPGRFFTDFIVELKNGVTVLIEYKMGKMSHDPEEKHKRAVGELWAQRSHGRTRFGWVVDRRWPEVERVLAE